MTKSDLIATVAARFPNLTVRDARESVDLMLSSMTAALREGHRVEVRGFGSFGIRAIAPRTGRNPKTGERVPVPGKYRPHFKPGLELAATVNRPDATSDAV